MFRNSTQFTLEKNLEFGKTIRIKTIIFFDLIVLFLGAIIGIESFSTDKNFAIMLWICFAVVVIALPFILNPAIKNSTKKMMQKNPLQDGGITNNFTFSEKVMLSTATKDGREISNLVISYSDIIKVIENKDNLYIFIGQGQAFLLSEDGMTEGTFHELRDFLKTKYIGGKYFIRKGIFHVKAK